MVYAEILKLLEIFRHMVNGCIEIGLSYDVTALKRLSMLYGRGDGSMNALATTRRCGLPSWRDSGY